MKTGRPYLIDNSKKVLPKDQMPQRLNAKTNAEITQNKVQKLKNKEMKERGVVLVGVLKITYRKGGDMF